jgi:hypothetical protein
MYEGGQRSGLQVQKNIPQYRYRIMDKIRIRGYRYGTGNIFPDPGFGAFLTLNQ